MKKFFLIFIPIILILTYIFYQNNLLPHPKYTNDDFGIQTYKSINDQDHDGIDDQSDIVQNVRKYIETKPQYKSKYAERSVQNILNLTILFPLRPRRQK